MSLRTVTMVVGLVAVAACTSSSARPLTPEEECCKRKARNQAEFARSLGMSRPASVVYRDYYRKCMRKGRCSESARSAAAREPAGTPASPPPPLPSAAPQ